MFSETGLQNVLLKLQINLNISVCRPNPNGDLNEFLNYGFVPPIDIGLHIDVGTNGPKWVSAGTKLAENHVYSGVK